MERVLLVGLAVTAVALGSSVSVLRPAVLRLDQAAPPRVPAGVVVESWSGGGAAGAPGGGRRRSRDVSRFPGRGPGGAK